MHKQSLLPGFPEGSHKIGVALSIVEKDGWVTYFVGGAPVHDRAVAGLLEELNQQEFCHPVVGHYGKDKKGEAEILSTSPIYILYRKNA